MVKTILAGLLVAGVTPMTAVNNPTATAAENNSQNVLLPKAKTTPVNLNSVCKTKNYGIVCSPFSTIKPTEAGSDLNLPGLAELFWSRSIALKCADDSSGGQWQGQKSQFNPSDYQSKCSLPWHSKFLQQPTAQHNTAIPTQESLQKLTESELTGDSVISRQFPKLSRSSLVIAFPPQNKTSEFKPDKLANPAPATKRIASPFGWRSRPYSNQLQFHQGIDYGAPLGSPVVAAGNGIVTKVTSGCIDFGSLFCGGQLGNWIEIDHGNGAIATYGHLKNSSITIKQGMKVQKNQQIAQVGSSGWSTGAHLDFRLKINGEYDNPTKYVAAISNTKI